MPNCTESKMILNSRKESYVYFLNTLKKLVKDFKYNELGFYEYDCDIKLHLAWAEESLNYILKNLENTYGIVYDANYTAISSGFYIPVKIQKQWSEEQKLAETQKDFE